MGNGNNIPNNKVPNNNTYHLKHEPKPTRPTVNVYVKGCYGVPVNETLVVSYFERKCLGGVFDEVVEEINNKYYPLKVEIFSIDAKSFTGYIVDHKAREIRTKVMADYDINEITTKGLHIKVDPQQYIHRINSKSIECEHMNKIKSKDPLHCPIYYAMKEKYEYNKNNLYHLSNYTHFQDEYNCKPQCKYMDQCKGYIRMENGENDLKDQCHMKLYRHPPRTRNIKLQENVNAFIFGKKQEENYDVYKPTVNDKKKYKYNARDGFLFALMHEVVVNGFKNDLCLLCGPNIECIHDGYSILTVVDDKMEHYRHKTINKPLNRGQMLSLILYTGGYCNYDLCASQRNGDYNRWIWFDYCLWWAINALSIRERGYFGVYSGLNNVKLPTKSVECGYFRTYVSTSWNEDLAKTFMKGSGMILHIDKWFKDHQFVCCCDVSWISKFPDECEVLFARSADWDGSGWSMNFKCIVLDEMNQIQRVSLQT